MAFDLKITNGVICVTLNGVLNSEDLRGAAESFHKLEAQAAVCPNRIIDLSSVDEVNLDFGAVEKLAALRNTTPLKNEVKSAIVATKPVQYGFARMFQTLNTNPKICLKLFTDRDAGWAWVNGGNKK